MFPEESVTRNPKADAVEIAREASQPASHDDLTLSDPALTEDQALALLKRTNLHAETIERLSKNSGAMKSRKVRLALVEHPKTPRHISLPMVRHLFTFDLMQVALTPATPADIKKTAEESLIRRLEAISEGEKLSLAHRASGQVAGELLLDPQPRVVRAALENPRLTEAHVVRALMRENSLAAFVHAVCDHPKWSLRQDVRVALVRNEDTPLARAREFASTLPAELVREVLNASRMADNVKSHLQREIENR